MKTTKEWIESIEDPKLRDLALTNMRKETNKVAFNPDTKRESLSLALYWAFHFSSTEQGHKFWNNKVEEFKSEEKKTEKEYKENCYNIFIPPI